VSVAELEAPVVGESSESWVQEIPIKDIEGVFDGEPASDNLVKSIERDGVINLPTVRPFINKAGYEVVEGRRRLQSLLRLGRETAEVVVNPNVDDAADASIISNYIRSENPIQAARVVWKRLDEGESDKDFANRVGINVAQVRALRDMRKLLPELIEAVESGAMKSWAARMAARHPEHVQKQLVERLHENGKVTADDVKEVRSVQRVGAVAEVGDLFDNLPELEGEYNGTGDDMTDDEPVVSGLGSLPKVEPKPKTKISRQDRLTNVKNYAQKIKDELLAIKSNTRSDNEAQMLFLAEEILNRYKQEQEGE
jgi:ParB-like chromosome segregation protein Spo0J